MRKQTDGDTQWWVAMLISTVAALTGCHAPGGDWGATASVASALVDGGMTNANLQLQVSKSTCTSNVAQNYFKITNSTTASVPLSQLAIKFWVNDTSAANMTTAVWYGGCVISSAGTCLHPVTGVTATATRFAPGCGPDAAHQATWEIVVTTTDTTPLAAGQTWANVQTATNLTTSANFSPGASTWFSTCGSNKPFAVDTNFAAYLNGALINNQGVTVPICRAPAVVQIQTFIDQTYYATSDIASSFVSAQSEAIDCIPLAAHHAVKAWAAAGVSIPTTFPSAPTRPASIAPPNVATNTGFNGQPDVNGHPRQCGAGQVPVKRPTVAQIQAAGGIDAFKLAQATRPRLRGSQASFEHDCWLNDAPGDGSAIGSANAVDWEHAAGVQTTGWAGGASGFFGAHVITPIYAPFMETNTTALVTGRDHTDSQFWIQTGGCEHWYSDPRVCDTGAACTTCTGAGCANCAVQSLEMASLTDPTKGTRLELFFTTDGYNVRNCFAGMGLSCTGCPTTTASVTPPGTGTPATEGTDCFVPLPGAQFMPDMQLAVNTSGTGGSQYGVVPNEIELSAWNGSSAGKPGWWIFVNNNLIGWFPPATFNWADNSAGPLSRGPASYLQAGGEVYDTWEGGGHTDTSMVSDNAAQAGYKYAAYNRGVGYYDGTQTFQDASLGFSLAPAAEGDNNIPGVCGLHSGTWTDAAGAAGAYTLATNVPAGGTGWGQYFYFGGGRLAQEQFPVRSPVTIRYQQYSACTSVPTNPGVASAGANAAYVVFQISGVDNSGSSSVPFAFDQTRLYVTDPHTGAKDHVNPSLALYPFIFGPFAAANDTFPANTDAEFQVSEDVGLTVSTLTADGAVEANGTAYTLQYDAQPGDPPVAFVKTNATKTSWPVQQDCCQIGLAVCQ